jgi:hypothetical protein
MSTWTGVTTLACLLRSLIFSHFSIGRFVLCSRKVTVIVFNFFFFQNCNGSTALFTLALQSVMEVFSVVFKLFGMYRHANGQID